jgi:hypothetical protein
MSFLKKGLLAALVFATVSSSALASTHNPGERVYNLKNDAYATVLGVAANGTYVIQFQSGTLAGQTGSNWTDADLAFTYGCLGNYCVGEQSYNLKNDAFVTVIGLQSDGRYAVQFTSGTLANQTGHNWANTDLAKLTGCYGNLCVGATAYNNPQQAQVTIVGIQTNNTFVVRFISGSLAGQTGHNWAYTDLVLISGSTPQPQPPHPFPQPQPQPPHPQPPHPAPQPAPGHITCVIRSGGSATGQQTFNVMTTSGAIIGTFPTSAQAAAFAQQDARCYQ